jgi:hypothetical protein
VIAPKKPTKGLTLAQGQRETMKLQVLLSEGKITQKQHDDGIRKLLETFLAQSTSQRR